MLKNFCTTGLEGRSLRGHNRHKPRSVQLVTNISYFPHKYCELRHKQLAISDLVSGHHVQMTVVGGENQIAVDGRAFHDGDVFVLISVAVTT